MPSLDSLFASARQNLGDNFNGSDRACFADAIRTRDEGDLEAAKRWALKSLAYSVGVFSPIYKRHSS